MAISDARTFVRPAGEGWKRLTIWVVIVGFPLIYGMSRLIPSLRAYYAGQAGYWYAGLDIRLFFVVVGGLLLWQTMRASHLRLSDIGWPRFRPWALGLFVLTLGAFFLVALHPIGGTEPYTKLSASTPIGTMERLSFLGLAVADAILQELLWRGAMLTWLRPVIGDVAAVLLCTVSYVFFYPQLGFGWSWLAAKVPVAVILMALVLWRKNVGTSVYVHFMVSALQLLGPI